eukprot:498846-Rhodomonas_salina.2
MAIETDTEQRPETDRIDRANRQFAGIGGEGGREEAGGDHGTRKPLRMHMSCRADTRAASEPNSTIMIGSTRMLIRHGATQSNIG